MALEDQKVRARLQSVTRRIALSGPDAEDAFQDAVVQALAHADHFRADSLVSTWLHRIFVNAALMGRRRSALSMRREVGAGQSILQEDGERVGPPGSLELRDVGPSPEELLAEHEQRERLRAAISRLPARSRKTVEALLRDEAERSEAMSGADGAQCLDATVARRARPVTSNAIRARLSRARARLKDLVGAMEMSAMPRAV